MSASSTPRQRVALPHDLATSLQYLDDADLDRLRAAVNTEIDRRRETTGARHSTNDVVATLAVSQSRPSLPQAAIPEGKANLVRASFQAGLKPAAIARTFGVSLSLVNRIIRNAKR